MTVSFSSPQKRIINALYIANRALTTTKVADKAEMSWVTADKYLHELRDKGYVENRRIGKAVYWKLR